MSIGSNHLSGEMGFLARFLHGYIAHFPFSQHVKSRCFSSLLIDGKTYEKYNILLQLRARLYDTLKVLAGLQTSHPKAKASTMLIETVALLLDAIRLCAVGSTKTSLKS